MAKQKAKPDALDALADRIVRRMKAAAWGARRDKLQLGFAAQIVGEEIAKERERGKA